MARKMTAEEREAVSARMKAYWSKRNGKRNGKRKSRTKVAKRTLAAAVTSANPDALVVESRIVLTIQGHELTLTAGAARQLREALTAALLPNELPSELPAQAGGPMQAFAGSGIGIGEKLAV